MSNKENQQNEDNVTKPPKKKRKGRVRVKRQMEVVITDLETVITELGTVVSELRGVLSQIEKVTSHLDGVYVNGKVSPVSEIPIRETVLSPVPQTNTSPEGSPITSAKRRLESLISENNFENGAVEGIRNHWKSPGLQLCHSPKLKNGTTRWFTDGETSFGSLSDVPSSDAGSTFSEILRNAGNIGGSQESIASGSVYFSPDKTQSERSKNSPTRSRHASGGSDDLCCSDFQANYNRDINTWTTYAMVHMDAGSLASASDCWDSETENLPNPYHQPSPGRRYQSPARRYHSPARCQQSPALRRMTPTRMQNIPVPST